MSRQTLRSMKKDIFKESSLVDKIKLRKERKALFIFIISAYLLEAFGMILILPQWGIVHESDGAIKYTDLPLFGLILGIIGIIILLLSFTCVITGLISLKKLTNIIYKKPNKYFIIFIILILLGYFYWKIFTIIALFIIWFTVRKLLVIDKSKGDRL